jgi:hypothetical protein
MDRARPGVNVALENYSCAAAHRLGILARQTSRIPAASLRTGPFLRNATIGPDDHTSARFFRLRDESGKSSRSELAVRDHAA